MKKKDSKMKNKAIRCRSFHLIDLGKVVYLIVFELHENSHTLTTSFFFVPIGLIISVGDREYK